MGCKFASLMASPARQLPARPPGEGGRPAGRGRLRREGQSASQSVGAGGPRSGCRAALRLLGERGPSGRSANARLSRARRPTERIATGPFGAGGRGAFALAFGNLLSGGGQESLAFLAARAGGALAASAGGARRPPPPCAVLSTSRRGRSERSQRRPLTWGRRQGLRNASRREQR